LFVGGLQDNGLVFRPGAGKPWRRTEGGDGNLAKFITADAALVIDNDDSAVHVAYWDGASVNRGATLVPAGLAPNTFTPTLGRVCFPVYRRGGDLMLVVAGNVASKTVHGLFDHKPWSKDDDRFR
jgi:hypothetical protein